MNLEPITDSNDSQSSWSFEVVEGRLRFQINVSGSISTDFAKHVLSDAIQRKQEAVLIGDGMSLDLLIGGLCKEAINDFGFVLAGVVKADEA